MFGWLKRKRAAEVKTLQDAMMAKMFGEPAAATTEITNPRIGGRPAGYGAYFDPGDTEASEYATRLVSSTLDTPQYIGQVKNVTVEYDALKADVRRSHIEVTTKGGFYVVHGAFSTAGSWNLMQHMPEGPPRFVRTYTVKSNATRAARKLNGHD